MVKSALVKKGKKTKAESPLDQVPSRREELPPIEDEAVSESMRMLETGIALLQGRVEPDPTDDTYLTLWGRKPLITDEFLQFEKPSEAIPLPPKGNDFREELEYYAKENQELIDRKAAGEETEKEPSYMHIHIFEDRNIAVITNTFFLPQSIKEEAGELASSLKKIISLGDESKTLTASGCFEELKFSLHKQMAYSELADEAFSKGKVKFAGLMQEISDTYGIIAKEMSSRIRWLGEGKGISEMASRTITPAQEKLKKLQKMAAEMQMKTATRALTGVEAIEKIERGIERGLYSNIEIAMYKQVSGQLNATLGRIKGFSKRGIERVSREGFDGLSGWQKAAVQEAISLVAHLECIAWKVDLKGREKALKAKVRGASQPVGMGRLLTHKHIPMHQLTAESREEMGLLGKRAMEHISYLKGFINHADDLTKSEKKKYSAKLDRMGVKAEKVLLPSELETLSRELETMLTGVEQVLSERHLEEEASDSTNPWNVRTSSYLKLYVLQHSLEIIGAGTAVGGVAGALSTRNPAGAWAGAKTGASVGSFIVASAGAFITGDAMHRYLSGTGNLEQAVEDMRLGATYMLFGLGGGPVAAISTPVKMIAGGGAALASSILMYEDIKKGNYWEVPADVAYIAIGGVAFLRTGIGAFRAIRLSKPLKSSMVIANSSGIARIALKAKDVAKARAVQITTRAMKVGYSPGWIGMNAAFGGLSQWNEISTAIENGNYSIALSSLNKGFAEVTRGMVGFDFALFGVAGSVLKAGAAPAARYFRVMVPAAQAKAASLLSAEGLYERVADMASKAGAKTFQAETNAQLLELVYASRGKVGAEYVQVTLGLESRAAAVSISKEINSSWTRVRRLISKGAAAGRGAWDKSARLIERASRTRAARVAAHGTKGAAVVGVIAYSELQRIEDEKLSEEIAQLLTKKEQQFVTSLLSFPQEDFGVPQLESREIASAMSLIDQISDEVDDGVHPLAVQLGLGGDIEKRKRFLFSCSLALMMEGREVTDKSLSSLASDMDSLLAETGIRLRVHSPVSTFSFMGSILLREGPDRFAKAYASMSRNVSADERYAYLDYIASSYYCALNFGRSTDWASDISYAAFSAFIEKDMEGNISGWTLARAFQKLDGTDYSPEQIIDIATRARIEIATGGFPAE
ncbi:hypothetical protein GF412_01470 [Candidatus Micrarchaeota archaeon]|nr:hypothetical protein [Candidatus Micrarchaeota archaeon]MBD3417638.1 hypothetical protein [Candidatus Micrarchaeota archaeon]